MHLEVRAIIEMKRCFVVGITGSAINANCDSSIRARGVKDFEDNGPVAVQFRRTVRKEARDTISPGAKHTNPVRLRAQRATN